MTNTLISFILPMYNVGNYIEKALDSIDQQEYKNWECIIINDGSTDNSQKVAENYIKGNDKFKLISQENAGSGYARNTGLENAKGEYICFVDPDDFIGSKALINNVDIATSYSPDIIANGYHELRGEKVITVTPQLEGLYNKKEFIENFETYKLVGMSSLWNKLYKKQFLTDYNITFTNQKVGQDTLFNFEAYKYVNSIYIDKNAYYYYNVGREGSAVNSFKNNKVKYEENISDAFFKLLKSWGKTDEFEKQMQVLNWRVIFNELLNINMKDAPYTSIEKVDHLKKLLSKNRYQLMLNTLDYKDIKSGIGRIIFNLLKCNQYKITNQLIKIYLKLY
ncbi:glycosyltransferase family 2 protein [Aerococcus viridans]|uniref:glycosyltransferase family 2 protein n=1 Tax=Aerococcus viridans TaxID=1377 RepID=UPI003B214D6E